MWMLCCEEEEGGATAPERDETLSVVENQVTSPTASTSPMSPMVAVEPSLEPFSEAPSEIPYPTTVSESAAKHNDQTPSKVAVLDATGAHDEALSVQTPVALEIPNPKTTADSGTEQKSGHSHSLLWTSSILIILLSGIVLLGRLLIVSHIQPGPFYVNA